MLCKAVFIAAITLFGAPSLCEKKGPMTPVNCRISWNEVKSYQFMVRWRDPSRSCAYFRVFLYPGYNDKEIRMYDYVKTEYKLIKNVKPLTIYGVKVECVDDEGRTSSLSRAGRTRTFGRFTTTTKPTTTTALPTAPMPVGSCGANYFTCETNQTECVHKSGWCDRVKDCRDGTDEKDCPGHCSRIAKFHVGGNFSCSRFNSRRSACFFQCNGEFVRDGPYYTICVRSHWNRPMPTCRLHAPDFEMMGNMATNHSITFHIRPMGEASKFVLVSTVDKDGNTVKAHLSIQSKDDKMEGTIDDLQADETYYIVLAAMDREGEMGFKSNPHMGKTAYMDEKEKKV